jgi:hypothetical protein
MTSGFYIVLLYSLAVTVGLFLAFFGYRYILRKVQGKTSGRAYVKVSRVPEGLLKGEVFLIFELPEIMMIRFSVTDLEGKEISLLLEGDQPEGELVVRIDTTAFSNGDYFIELNAPAQKIQRKITIGNV